MTAPPDPASVPGHDDMQWEEQAMQTEIIAKATGTTTTTTANVIVLSAPSVVRLNSIGRRSQMTREGNDLIIRLTDGQTIRIDHFYDQQQGKASDLVLREDQGSQWLANPFGQRVGPVQGDHRSGRSAGCGRRAGGGGSSFRPARHIGMAGVGGLVAAVRAAVNGGNQPGPDAIRSRPQPPPPASPPTAPACAAPARRARPSA